MKKIILIVVLSTVAVSLSGCMTRLAQLTGDMDNITGRAIGVAPERVTRTYNVDADAFSTTWNADVDGEQYYCTATDTLKEVRCNPA